MNQFSQDKPWNNPAQSSGKTADDALSQARMPQFVPDQLMNPDQLTPNAQIQQLLKSGLCNTALGLLVNNVTLLTKEFGPTHPFSLYGLSGLMEASVRANNSSAVSNSQVKLLSEELQNRANNLGHFRMQSLARLSEFTSYFGDQRPELQETAREALSTMHMCYPFADIEPVTRQFCAMSQLTSATSASCWVRKEERPDFRELDYIAACGRERLEQFSPEESEFYYSLYELRRNWTESALTRLEQLIENSETTQLVRLVAVEASIQGCIISGRSEQGRELYQRLQEELTRAEPIPQLATMAERSDRYRARLFPESN